ncbi:hypothetical protein BCR33DRAFT_711238 [Rhizoclosmatium globosum]|uniref:Transmembrane protein n=1 Tax=Rhizoclosmatium globosum TaxID=329046 RepID=A0A1Y2D5P8_9FUNG|nr:hypothetical protein BCR33DRAFT_711238 [Rhizoclosmatium globosum]|eukprot:ORY53895.1 hypothetical protein BCR33DRAFT_711238 [Rhizoclosmatium globosum]
MSNVYNTHPRYVTTTGQPFKHPGTAPPSLNSILQRIFSSPSPTFSTTRKSTRKSKTIKAVSLGFAVLFLFLYGRSLVGWFLGHHLVIEHRHSEAVVGAGTASTAAVPNLLPLQQLPQQQVPQTIENHSVLVAVESGPGIDAFTKRALLRAVFRNYTMQRVTASKLHLVFYWDFSAESVGREEGDGSSEVVALENGRRNVVKMEERVYGNDILHAPTTFDFLSHIHSLAEYDHVFKITQNNLVRFDALETAFQSTWTANLDLQNTGLFVSAASRESSFYGLSMNLVYHLTHSISPDDDADATPASIKQGFEKSLTSRVDAIGLSDTSKGNMTVKSVKRVLLYERDVGGVVFAGLESLSDYFGGVREL